MTIEIIQTYAAYSTTDEYGKLGGVHGYFENEGDAMLAAAGIGWWGGPGRVVPCMLIAAYGRCYPIAAGHEEGFSRELLGKNMVEESRKTKEGAWAKIQAALTPDEIKELGLKEPQP